MGCEPFHGKASAATYPMKIAWDPKAIRDLARLHEFLTSENSAVAAKVVQNLVTTADRLQNFPRMGERLDRYDPHELRRIFAGPYEIRYRLTVDAIFILRVWHGHERR